MQKFFRFSFIFICCLLSGSAAAKISWHSWVVNLRKEAIHQGINPVLFDRVFQNMRPSAKHIRLDRTQPEKRLTYYEYRDTRADAYRIKMGQKELKKHQDLLNKVGKDFEVNPCVIASLWGLESSYGHFMGQFNVIQSLATLAYDGRRSDFFRKQLLLALHMLDEGHVTYQDFKGEWAGASGQPQFLPSSFYQYAIDYDGDGKKDIWKNYGDIFASIANYLKQNGWEYKQPILITTRLIPEFDHTLIGIKIIKPYQEWLNLGARPSTNRYINPNAAASIIELTGGPIWIVFNNFKSLMKWNHSTYYAGTVTYMAQKICQTSPY
ncbi:MAG: lytic murein transglycosylase [Gammaproteobacteria bacterium]|nr:lytic murein transglycosylase [Gammaproteobacteria bacterium]